MEGQIFVTERAIAGERNYAGRVVLAYNVQYPQFSTHTASPVIRRINAMYRRQAFDLVRNIQATYYLEAVAEYLRRREQGIPFAPYEFDRPFTVTYALDCILSLYMDEYQYIGGANGVTTRTSDTWNIQTGERIPLSELFAGDEDYRAELETFIEEEIAVRKAENSAAYFDDYAALVERYFNESNFYLTLENLVIYFQEGEIAPHATGIPEFPIPYSMLFILLPSC